MNLPQRVGLAIAALAALPLTAGCVTETQMRMAVQDRDREIAMLREEKVELQERLDMLAYEKQSLRSALDSAESQNVVPASMSEAAPATYVSFPELDEAGVEYGIRGGNVIFSMPAEITFASGKASLSREGRAALSQVAKRLKSEFEAGSRFYVEGHTDSDPIKRSAFDSNRALSLARAMAVLEYLVTEGQVDDDRFVVVGHGQYSPLAANGDKTGKAKNRRVEIVVHSGDA